MENTIIENEVIEEATDVVATGSKGSFASKGILAAGVVGVGLAGYYIFKKVKAKVDARRKAKEAEEDVVECECEEVED